MEKKDNINIAEILKGCPEGTKLYSPLFGNVEFFSVNEDNIPINVRISKGRTYDYYSFTSEGYYFTGYYDAECLLFPSREMRDWRKFFKRGDVLINDGYYRIDEYYCKGVLFKEWVDDSYTSFRASICQLLANKEFEKRSESVFPVKAFDKASDEQRDKFIADMEKYFGDKYNPETLQVEPVKPECPFKAFDKVLVRNNDQHIWKAALFSHYNTSRDDHNYVIIPSFAYNWCIPYEGNEHLLGTTEPYTEGGKE